MYIIHTKYDNFAQLNNLSRNVFSELTLKTMCSSILSPALPGYLSAMLAGVRSNILAPTSVQIACINIFFPTPRGPVIITEAM